MSPNRPTEVARDRFAGKRVAVVGLAREGTALVRFLSEAGARVIANDRGTRETLAGTLSALSHLPLELVLGGHPVDPLLAADCIFVSPGVPQELDVLAQARARGIPLSSETQLFFELCPGRIIGITGSSGKSTTTALVGEMLRQAGYPVHVGGNIGVPLLEKLDAIGSDDWVVLEMSSFQLETLPHSPHVGAVLNVTPNHLDRHISMERYLAAKANIVAHQSQGDWAVLNADDRLTRELMVPGELCWFSLDHPVEGAYLAGDQIVLQEGDERRPLCSVGEVRLRGRHNLSNVLAAAAIASIVGVPPEGVRAAIAGFQGVPHRLELVRQVAGVSFFNDSIATAPERSIASLRSFDEPVVLIAGGRTKNLPLEEWARVIVERAKGLVLLGETSDGIEAAVLGVPGGEGLTRLRAAGMQEAVRLAFETASRDEVVLLAPGFTSFDMYRDFEERGERFRQAVHALARDIDGEMRH